MPYQLIQMAIAKLVQAPGSLTDQDLEVLQRLNLPAAASITRARALADAALTTPAKTSRRRTTA
jgi:hypothetical protein